MKKIALVVFPGMNCEVESYRTLKRAGFAPQIILWNEDKSILRNFDGIMLPGGFSFEDRGRSGVVSAKEPILEGVRELAEAGKPVLGVCNGAQVLVEAGLAPGFKTETEMALARNKRISEEGEILGTGFYHTWVYMKSIAPKGRCAFNNFEQDLIFHVPIAHGEGRFTGSKEYIEAIEENQMNVFTYCDQEGNVIENFPINPNGSAMNIAGLCNTNGNVLALMPHPERTFTSDAIFNSMHKWFEGEKNIPSIKIPEEKEQKPAETPDNQIEFFVNLKITDNTEKTIEKALQKLINDQSVELSRWQYWGIKTKSDNLVNLAEELIKSGEIFNENKENALVKIGTDFYSYQNGELKISAEKLPENSYLARENEDFIGQAKFEKINHHLEEKNITNIESGILWAIKAEKNYSLEDLQKTYIFQNPVAGSLIQV